LTRRLIMDLVCIVIFEIEYSIAVSWNPPLNRLSHHSSHSWFAPTSPITDLASPPRSGQKVYRADWQRPEFLGHLIHALAAAAKIPFLTTRARDLFPLELGPAKNPDAAKNGLLFAG